MGKYSYNNTKYIESIATYGKLPENIKTDNIRAAFQNYKKAVETDAARIETLLNELTELAKKNATLSISILFSLCFKPLTVPYIYFNEITNKNEKVNAPITEVNPGSGTFNYFTNNSGFYSFDGTQIIPNIVMENVEAELRKNRISFKYTYLTQNPICTKDMVLTILTKKTIYTIFQDLLNNFMGRQSFKYELEILESQKSLVEFQNLLIDLVKALVAKNNKIKAEQQVLADYKARDTDDNIYLSAGTLPQGIKVYPKEFFNIPNPSGTFIDIQVRTNYDMDKKIYEAGIWSSITNSKNNNFFEQMTLEDEGLMKLNLSLTDINFGELEDLLNRTILLSNITKQSITDPANGSAPLELMYKPEYGTNLRIRFGYGHLDNNYIDSTSLNETFAKRIKDPECKKTVIRSPWLYFQLVGLNYVVSDIGLTANILAWEIRNVPLKSLQFVKRNSVIIAKGETAATEIITFLDAELEKILGKDSVEIIFDPKSFDENVPNNDWSKVIPYATKETINGQVTTYYEIKLVLGDKASDFRYNNGTKNFSTIDELLRDFCNQIEPKYFDNKGFPVVDKANAVHQAPFTFNYNKKENKIIIKFYYDNKLKTVDQESFRIYEWRETKDSIIENLSIQSSLDFAQLNAPIYNMADGSLTAIKSLISPTQANTYGVATLDNEFSLVGRVLATTAEGSNNSPEALINRFRNNMDRSIFDGEITIPGDPFYIFDTAVEPYKYGIYIFINRNGYLTKDNHYVKSDRSYLSGFYIIKKIIHTIDNSGFKTKLSLTKYPLVDRSILLNALAATKEIEDRITAAGKEVINTQAAGRATARLAVIEQERIAALKVLSGDNDRLIEELNKFMNDWYNVWIVPVEGQAGRINKIYPETNINTKWSGFKLLVARILDFMKNNNNYVCSIEINQSLLSNFENALKAAKIAYDNFKKDIPIGNLIISFREFSKTFICKDVYGQFFEKIANLNAVIELK